MDPRIRRHAGIIVDHSTDVAAGDRVLVAAQPAAEDLAVAVFELLGERGARPAMAYMNDTYLGSDRAVRSYLRNVDAEELPEPDHLRTLIEASDVVIRVRGHDNATELSDVASESHAAYRRAVQDVQQSMLATRWCLTQFPTHAGAQLAGMSAEAYENFVWDAIIRDWDAQREHQARMVEILDPAAEVHIVSGERTDVTMSVDGYRTINDYGENNLPGGEVFTAPDPESVEGTVHFDMPLYHKGQEVLGASLEFEDGVVVGHAAERNVDVLTGILDTDEGARRLGELGIGMNRAIDRFSYNMLFDEKMGDTVHMAVGMAYAECVPADAEPNRSAEHVDMIVDMSEDSYIEVDGEVVQRDGTFVFEDGFEG